MTRQFRGLRMRRVLDSGPRGRGPLRGFTLVELLIAMTLTLLLVYAIAQFYAYVGETVRDGRAQIEMGGHLRSAANRLQKDFAELTVRVGGRIDVGSAQGYLELWEGQATDSDPDGDLGDADGDGVVDSGAATFYVSNNIADVNGDLKPDSAMLGDCDDILSMTIRSQGEPFVGRQCVQVPGSSPPQFNYLVVQSNLAEVVWFTTFKDVNTDGIWQITEPRYLVRRQLLIMPGTPLTSPSMVTANTGDFFQHNDISAHFGPGPGYAPIANSLSDLSQRENRFAHTSLSAIANNGLLAAQGYMPNRMQILNGIPAGNNHNLAYYCLDGIPQFAGEDKMLSNLLAFDIRVYDPYAPLRADNQDISSDPTTLDDDAAGVIAPGDPGYAAAVLRNPAHPIMGYGAYVDLWYNRSYRYFPPMVRSAVMQNSAYSWAPQARNYPGGAIWDTWTNAYEKDGIAQSIPAIGNFSGYPQRAQADWMVDGLDNDNSAGVDDPGEAETRPPYPVYVGDNGVDDDFDGSADNGNEVNINIYPRPIPTMLRGIEVRIRMYEPGTRQTRQVTVATDFIPE